MESWNSIDSSDLQKEVEERIRMRSEIREGEKREREES